MQSAICQPHKAAISVAQRHREDGTLNGCWETLGKSWLPGYRLVPGTKWDHIPMTKQVSFLGVVDVILCPPTAFQGSSFEFSCPLGHPNLFRRCSDVKTLHRCLHSATKQWGHLIPSQEFTSLYILQTSFYSFAHHSHSLGHLLFLWNIVKLFLKQNKTKTQQL